MRAVLDAYAKEINGGGDVVDTSTGCSAMLIKEIFDAGMRTSSVDLPGLMQCPSSHLSFTATLFPFHK